jgi:hypothetical protein
MFWRGAFAKVIELFVEKIGRPGRLLYVFPQSQGPRGR